MIEITKVTLAAPFQLTHDDTVGATLCHRVSGLLSHRDGIVKWLNGPRSLSRCGEISIKLVKNLPFGSLLQKKYPLKSRFLGLNRCQLVGNE